MRNLTYREREALNLLTVSNRSGNNYNHIRLFRNNTYEHEFAKFLLAWELIKQDHIIMTEAIFQNGKRADLLDATTGVVYEILHSETEKMLQEKVKGYPAYFLVQSVKAKDVINKVKDLII